LEPDSSKILVTELTAYRVIKKPYPPEGGNIP
jgi:hypothetical protein